MLIMQAANFVWEFINTFVTSLSTPIHKFLTFLWAIWRQKLSNMDKIKNHGTVHEYSSEQQFCKSTFVVWKIAAVALVQMGLTAGR